MDGVPCRLGSATRVDARRCPLSSGPTAGLSGMAFEHLLAQSVVTDLETAERWYSLLFERPPDARPMDGLLEWHLSSSFGVQVWRDAARAGGSTLVLAESDLDDRAARLGAAGLDHDGPRPASASRVLVLTDPDGNQVVVTGMQPARPQMVRAGRARGGEAAP